MSRTFDALVEVMSRLRGEGGCPWDREQSHSSLKPYLVEETYEVIEAIDSEKPESLCEELGDLLFQVLFHSQIAKERNAFDIESVLETIKEKMTRRHPHVFVQEVEKTEDGQQEALQSQSVLVRWEEIKSKEPGNQQRKSALDGVPRNLPPLLRAHQLQTRAARVGFDWKSPEPVFEKIEEELQELREAIEEKDLTHIENELGDLLFSIVNYARFLKINPEDAMRGSIHRFTERFQKVESQAKQNKRKLSTLSLDEMNTLWEAAKREEGE